MSDHGGHQHHGLRHHAKHALNKSLEWLIIGGIIVAVSLAILAVFHKEIAEAFNLAGTLFMVLVDLGFLALGIFCLYKGVAGVLKLLNAPHQANKALLWTLSVTLIVVGGIIAIASFSDMRSIRGQATTLEQSAEARIAELEKKLAEATSAPATEAAPLVATPAITGPAVREVEIIAAEDGSWSSLPYIEGYSYTGSKMCPDGLEVRVTGANTTPQWVNGVKCVGNSLSSDGKSPDAKMTLPPGAGASSASTISIRSVDGTRKAVTAPFSRNG